MLKKSNSNVKRQKRQLKVRKNISGTPESPRLNVYRSLNHIYAQVIDDVAGKTLVSASTLDKDLSLSSTGNKEAAREVGKAVAKKATEQGIEKVVFDRAGYLYHGRIKELADGAREGGLRF